MPSDAIQFDVHGQIPPLKNLAISMWRGDHEQATRVRALLLAAAAAQERDRFTGFGARRIGMKLVCRPLGAGIGDPTNALGGVADTLQAIRPKNVDLTNLGELVNVCLFDNGKQIREMAYREEPGELGHTIRLWAL
jgi:hypothetical protein